MKEADLPVNGTSLYSVLLNPSLNWPIIVPLPFQRLILQLHFLSFFKGRNTLPESFLIINTGMDNVAEDNVDAGIALQQATLACTSIVNAHETHQVLYPAHASQMIRAKITNLATWKQARNSYFLKMIFFLFVNL